MQQEQKYLYFSSHNFVNIPNDKFCFHFSMTYPHNILSDIFLLKLQYFTYKNKYLLIKLVVKKRPLVGKIYNGCRIKVKVR